MLDFTKIMGMLPQLEKFTEQIISTVKEIQDEQKRHGEILDALKARADAEDDMAKTLALEFTSQHEENRHV